ncbi:MAG: glycosyltransferase family A protein, partial [Acidobacteria bacterium]|nr:glycosyltransferase family A protein [Acidobacteriota bacterium]
MAVGNPEAQPPLVSVIIPTYNRADYLEQALSSVFRQTFTDYEVIVVDDGSTDHTPDVLKSYQERITSLRQENSGAARARNRGIRLARGNWVAFLDSDDMWQPVALERLVAGAAQYPEAGLITMRGLLMKSDGEVTDRIVGKRSPGPSFTTRSRRDKDSGGVLTPMVQRRVLEDVGGYDESLRTAHDCDLWLRIS